MYVFVSFEFVAGSFTPLQRPDVVNALHAIAPAGNWIECRRNVHTAFHEYSENSSITILPQILTKIPVLIFAGDQDLICNYVGLEAMIKEMTWNGAKGLGVGDSFGIYPFYLPCVNHRLSKRNRGP